MSVRPRQRRARLRRGLLLVSIAAAAWSWGVLVFGGIVIDVAGVGISSRNPVNPLVLALAGMAAWGMLAPAGWRSARVELRAWLEHADRIIERDASPHARLLAPIIVAATCLVVVMVGITKGAFVAGGADSYGYVSQARLWASGSLRSGEAILQELSGAVDSAALVPLGYVLAPDSRAVVPQYPSGLPLVMALFAGVAGPNGVFFVVPLLAGVAVAACYGVGQHLGGPVNGAAAALLLAASPTFLFMLTAAPMSDVPVTAWWALALAMLPRHGKVSALIGGLAMGLAILTRPNLVPVSVVPAGWLLWDAAVRRERRTTHRLLLFAAGAVPGCLAVGLTNAYLFGSPFSTGYGPLEGYYGWEHLAPNLLRYPRWLIETQTPLVLFAFAAPIALRRWRQGEATTYRFARAWMVVSYAFVSAVVLMYLWYLHFDAWWFLRFLLPAFPSLFALLCAGILAATNMLPVGRSLAAAALVVAIATYGISSARKDRVFKTDGELKYARVGEVINALLPERAVIFSMQHSGSARLYSGRATVRYDLLAPDELEPAIDELRRRGYHPYFVLEPWEEQIFRARFGAVSRFGALDWSPLVRVAEGAVNIYDPSNRPI